MRFFYNNIVHYGLLGYIFDALIVLFVIGCIIGAINLIPVDEYRKRRNGEKYERFTASIIYKFFKIMPIRNILLQTFDDETEIDMAFVCKKGVFVIESKFHSRRHSPVLVGSLNDKVWGVSYGTTMNNPFDQNHKHIKMLEQILNVKSVYSIVYSSCPFEFRYFGKIRKSKKEPFFNILANEHKGIVYDNKGSFHKGTKDFFRSVLLLNDVYTDSEVENIIKKLDSMKMSKKERKEFAQRMMTKYYTNN